MERVSECCGNYWGPVRPFFRKHSLAEAGGSHFVPTVVFVVTRLLTTVYLGAWIAIFFSFAYYWSFPEHRLFLIFQSPVLHVISFILLFACSFALSWPLREVNSPNIFANIAVPIAQVSTLAAPYISGVQLFLPFVTRPSYSYTNLVFFSCHVPLLFFVLLEYALSTRRSVRITELILFIPFLILHIVSIRLYFHGALEKKPGAWIYSVLIAWGVGSSLIVFGVLHLYDAAIKCFLRRREHAQQDNEEYPVEQSAQVDEITHAEHNVA